MRPSQVLHFQKGTPYTFFNKEKNLILVNLFIFLNFKNSNYSVMLFCFHSFLHTFNVISVLSIQQKIQISFYFNIYFILCLSLLCEMYCNSFSIYYIHRMHIHTFFQKILKLIEKRKPTAINSNTEEHYRIHLHTLNKKLPM